LIAKNKNKKKFYSTVFMVRSLRRGTAKLFFTPAARQPRPAHGHGDWYFVILHQCTIDMVPGTIFKVILQARLPPATSAAYK